jgi:hypothetical protein
MNPKQRTQLKLQTGGQWRIRLWTPHFEMGVPEGLAASIIKRLNNTRDVRCTNPNFQVSMRPSTVGAGKDGGGRDLPGAACTVTDIVINSDLFL